LVYITERSEFFTPGRKNRVEAIYLGHLEEAVWFTAPVEFPRP
jgi:hypothetical protein